MKKYSTHLVIIFLIAASFIAFGRIAYNGFVNFDDSLYVTENQHVQSGLNAETIKWAFTAVVSSNWHPLTLISHAVDWSLFKDSAGGHHLISLFIHLAGSIILFLLLNRMSRMIWPSAFCAAFFALHPLRVESVAWAAERKDVLSMLFGLGSLYAYVDYVKKPQAGKYIICLALFIAALMSKPMLVTLPFVMLLIDYWPLERLQQSANRQKPPAVHADTGKKKRKRRKSDKMVPHSQPTQSQKWKYADLIWEKVPFFVLAALSSALTIWAQQESITPLKKLAFSERFINAINAYVAYLIKMFWPTDLAVFYPYQSSFPWWQIFGASILLIGISVAVIYTIKKAPFLFVGWFWYLGTLIPVIGLVQVGAQAMADRYTYLPSIGIGIMLAWGIPFLAPDKAVFKKVMFTAASFTLVVLTTLTWQQCGYWKNSIELFRHALRVTQNNDLAHYNLGIALAAEGKDEETIQHYQEAIKIKPKYGNAHYNLAIALQKQGHSEEALQHFSEAIKINPHHADAHNNLGIILDKQYNRNDEAIYHYREALKIEPNNPEIHYNLGIVMGKKGNLAEAIDQFRQALNLKPDDEQARVGLNMALEMQKEQKR